MRPETGRIGVTGMTIRQEVRVRTGALTEGTRHRGDKGVDLDHQVSAEALSSMDPRGDV